MGQIVQDFCRRGTGAQRHKGERKDWAQLPSGLEGALIERVF